MSLCLSFRSMENMRLPTRSFLKQDAVFAALCLVGVRLMIWPQLPLQHWSRPRPSCTRERELHGWSGVRLQMESCIVCARYPVMGPTTTNETFHSVGMETSGVVERILGYPWVYWSQRYQRGEQ